MNLNPIYSAALERWKAKPGNSVYISTADTAKCIRATLKAKFPRTRFSVRSKSCSGGSSIRVNWIDGPTDKLVEAYLAPFEGAGFDGSIDLKFYCESWLNPDGTASVKSSGGTEGSMGRYAGYTSDPDKDGAIPVKFGADYVFADRSYSPAALERVAIAYAAKNFDDSLTDAIKAGAIKIDDNGCGSAWFGNADDFRSGAPGSDYGARTVLMQMARRRMLPDAIPA